MEREQMLEALKSSGATLPRGWHLLGDEKLTELYNSIGGETMETANKVTPQNPFGETLVDVLIPTDQLNPEQKVIWISVNGVDIYFPRNKQCKMPVSYYNVYLNSMQSEAAAAAKLDENKLKEI